MTMLTAHPRIPYGESDLQRIRLNRWLYVDKSRFLRRLEEELLFCDAVAEPC